ncbi:hypothetical protein KUL17_18820 [Alteromonas sp. KUL17]|nr:hypothetical protein KUL17_18820 [Alteromonas sp. KUL17]
MKPYTKVNAPTNKITKQPMIPFGSNLVFSIIAKNRITIEKKVRIPPIAINEIALGFAAFVKTALINAQTLSENNK